jgi:DNA-binding CsgD family transcriptional regulator
MKPLMQTEYLDPKMGTCTIVKVAKLDHSNPRIQAGLILVDRVSEAFVAIDPVAAEIIDFSRSIKQCSGPSKLEGYVREEVRRIHRQESRRLQRSIRINGWKIVLRTYIMENYESSRNQTLIAVLVERRSEELDAIEELAEHYKLTETEQQVLRAMSAGLSIKAVASRMHLPYSTLRAFLRLIKIKLGVFSRAEIMVKILETASS